MPTMNISLPEGLKQWVEKMVKEGHYASASEYIRELIREDDRREKARARMDEFEPNEETVAAMEECKRGDLQACNTVEELMDHLNAPDDEKTENPKI